MSRRSLPIGSSHAIAFLALVLAVGGGGYAVAQDAAEPQLTVGLQTHSGRSEHPATPDGASLVHQLVYRTGVRYAVTSKLNLRKLREDSPGRVRCFLGAFGRTDRAVASLDRGEAANLTLTRMGSTGEPGSTNAIDLYCDSNSSGYVVTNARTMAVQLDDIETVEP